MFSYEQELATLTELTGIAVPPLLSGPSDFFRALPKWLFNDGDDNYRHVVVFADPALNLSLPYAEDELLLALAGRGRRAPARQELLDHAELYHLSPDLLNRPVVALSGGERMLVSLAKAAARAGAAEHLTLCSPFPWLDNGNKHLVYKVREAFEAAGGKTAILTLAGEAPGAEFVPSPLPELPRLKWSVLFGAAQVTFPASRFPRETKEKVVRVDSALGGIELLSPTVFLGPNGVGKTTVAKMLAGLLASEYDQPSAVVGGYSGNARLIMQDTVLQLFGQSVAGHLQRVFKFDEKRRDEAVQLFERLQDRCAKTLAAEHGSYHVGDRERPSSILQAKLALVAERLVSRPPLLILDEPGWCLSVNSARAFLHAVTEAAHERNTAILLISHQPHWWTSLTGDVITLTETGSTLRFERMGGHR